MLPGRVRVRVRITVRVRVTIKVRFFNPETVLTGKIRVRVRIRVWVGVRVSVRVRVRVWLCNAGTVLLVPPFCTSNRNLNLYVGPVESIVRV